MKLNSIRSNRIFVRYNCPEKDGVIELRRGVDDISIGDHKHAQVRIPVDKILYLKGLAVYSDDIPEEYDLVYNLRRENTIYDYPFDYISCDPWKPFDHNAAHRDGYGKCIYVVNDDSDWNGYEKEFFKNASKFLAIPPVHELIQNGVKPDDEYDTVRDEIARVILKEETDNA